MRLSRVCTDLHVYVCAVATSLRIYILIKIITSLINNHHGCQIARCCTYARQVGSCCKKHCCIFSSSWWMTGASVYVIIINGRIKICLCSSVVGNSCAYVCIGLCIYAVSTHVGCFNCPVLCLPMWFTSGFPRKCRQVHILCRCICCWIYKIITVTVCVYI